MKITAHSSSDAELKVLQTLADAKLAHQHEIELIISELNTNVITTLDKLMQSGDFEERVDIHFSDLRNDWKLSTESIAELFKAIESKCFLKKLYIEFSHCEISDQIGLNIANFLKSDKCPQNLNLSFGHSRITEQSVIALANVLSTGLCSQGLGLDFGDYLHFSHDCVKAFEQALLSGNCPNNMMLKLDSHIKEVKIAIYKAYANGLQSGKCPKGLALRIPNLPQHAEYMGDSLISGRTTRMLLYKMIINALKKLNYPDGLTITGNHYSFSYDSEFDYAIRTLNKYKSLINNSSHVDAKKLYESGIDLEHGVLLNRKHISILVDGLNFWFKDINQAVKLFITSAKQGYQPAVDKINKIVNSIKFGILSKSKSLRHIGSGIEDSTYHELIKQAVSLDNKRALTLLLKLDKSNTVKVVDTDAKQVELYSVEESKEKQPLLDETSEAAPASPAISEAHVKSPVRFTEVPVYGDQKQGVELSSLAKSG